MIQYSDKRMEMVCDDCGEESEFYGSWKSCIEEAKDEGWRMFKYHEIWNHKCPFCILGVNKPIAPETSQGVENIFPEVSDDENL